MLRSCHKYLFLIACLSLAAGRAGAAEWDWISRVMAYWGALDGAPQDVNAFLGVSPDGTDGWDEGIDSKKPGEPMGPYLYTWFNRPVWDQGPIMADYRGPIPEDGSRRWGTAEYDTWNVKTNLDNGASGVFDETCGFAHEYPVAASIYITWQLGVGGSPPELVPPDDYTFTLIYSGGINPKPAGTKLPDAMAPPAIGATWDMEATPHIVIPLWRIDFQPLLPDCSGFFAPDTAKFWILVNNPDTVPTCAISVDPAPPQRPPVTLAFTAAATGDEPFTFSWDFGDGAIGTGNPTSHTYEVAGTYAVTCAVTDANGDTTSSAASVEVSSAAPGPPTCAITHSPSQPTGDDTVTFDAGAADPGGTVVSVDWDFGDGHSATGSPAAHAYADPGTYIACATVTDDDGEETTCCAQVTVASPCLCGVAIDRRHCRMPAAGHVGQRRMGRIGARNESPTEPCAVVVRVTDNAGNAVFESGFTIPAGRSIRASFTHCYTPDEAGKHQWTWEVWPLDCGERTPGNNVLRRKVNVRP